MNSKEWRDWITGQGGLSSTPKADIVAIVADLEAAERLVAALEAENSELRQRLQAEKTACTELRELVDGYQKQRDEAEAENGRLRTIVLALNQMPTDGQGNCDCGWCVLVRRARSALAPQSGDAGRLRELVKSWHYRLSYWTVDDEAMGASGNAKRALSELSAVLAPQGEQEMMIRIDRASNGDRAIETRAVRRADGGLDILSTRDVTEEQQECPSCRGTGIADMADHREVCRTCEGIGSVPRAGQDAGAQADTLVELPTTAEERREIAGILSVPEEQIHKLDIVPPAPEPKEESTDGAAQPYRMDKKSTGHAL